MKTSAFKSLQRGLTLIELMIGLTISVILAGVVLVTLSYLYRQNIVSGNELATNNEARSGLDKLSRDVSSAGFLIGGMQNSCALTVSYNGNIAANSGYSSFYPVSAQSAPQTTLAGFTLPGTTTTLSYPVAGSNIPTSLLAVSFAPNGTQLTSASSPQLSLGPFGTTQSSPGQGAINSTQLPILNIQGVNQGDMALLEVPMSGTATNGQQALICMLVPIKQVGPATGSSYAYVKSAPSSLMPSNGYTDYSTYLSGLGYGSLSNALLQQAKLLDIGPLTSSNQETVYYYVDDSQYSFPVLMRTVVDTVNDTILSSTPIAAGVVSLQVLFGVAPAGSKYPSGSVTQYLTWQDVLSQNLTREVRTVQIALVVRSLHPDSAYTAPQTISIPNPTLGPDTFTAYPVQLNETHDHFQVYTTAVALRNLLWHP